MLHPTMYSVFLILTLFIASSASANSFLLADEILKMQTECDYYIKQTDNVILEGSETFPMNPGVDYFKCVDKLDNLKRQYIRDNLLGLSFYPEIFPMRLSNGTLLIMSAPAEDESSELSTRYSDSNHLEEMCSIHKSCSRILDRLNESIAKEKSSQTNYLKIKRVYCLEILDRLKEKYIKDNNLNIDFLKAYGVLSVMCKNGRTTMSLPKSLGGEENSRDLVINPPVQSKLEDSSISDSKDDKDDESSSESASYKGAYYNEVGLSIRPIVSHKEEDPVKSTSPTDSLKTSQISSVNPEEMRRTEEIPSVDHDEKIDLSKDHIGSEVSKLVKTDQDAVRGSDSVDSVLPVPEVDNTLQSIGNVNSASRGATYKNTQVSPIKQDGLETASFYMKATDTDILSEPVSSLPKQSDNEKETSNLSSYVNSNQDNSNNGEKDKTDVTDGIGKETSINDDKDKINDKSDNSGSKIKISSVSFGKDNTNNDDVKNRKEKDVKSDNNHRIENNDIIKSEAKEVNSEDLKIDNGNINISSETESSKTGTSANQDTDEDIKTGAVIVKSDSTKDKSEESLDASNIGESPAKADISKDSAENHGGEVVSNKEPDHVASVVGPNSKDPDMTIGNSDHNGPRRSSLPQMNLALDHPPITTATPSPDTVGDELIDREEDCKQLLTLASRLLQYRTASYLDKEYAACVEKLNQMKIQYIKSHSVDINNYRTLFPVTLSDGTESLVQLPPLHSESSTLPNTKSSGLPPPHTDQDDMFYDGDGLDDARVWHRSTNYVNRVQMENPAFIPNKKFLEYFNNQEPPGEASTLSKFANMIYRNVGLSEKKTEE